MNNDISLIIICGTLQSGGAERVLSILSTPFADNFRKVTLITWREAPHFYKIDSRVSVVSLPLLAKSDNDIIKFHALRKYIKKNKPNIVLSFLTIFNIFTLISLFGIKIPIIVAERLDPRFLRGGSIMKSFRNMMYRFSDGILCQTKSIKEYFKGGLRTKTHIIYNPVILPQEYIGKAIETTKKKNIVSIGRLHPQKNQKLLIDSFIQFHRNHPDHRLIIYGTGPLKEELDEYIKKKHMEQSIELAGEQKDVKSLILDAKAFIMTSDYEGMPNALIEAMCIGLPCISTKVSGAVDLIKNNENGLLVDSSTGEIGKALSYIVDNPESAKEMAKNAIKVYDQLQVDIISKQWIDYLVSKIDNNA